MKELNGKAALVTGASRGIGEAAARKLAASGVAVLLAARDVDSCNRIAAEIREAGGTAQALRCDVANYGDMEAAVAATLEHFGRLDILVNNAGMVEPIARIEESDPEAWARNISVNLLGVYHGIRAALRPLRAAGGGVIINISSGAAHQPLEGWSAYCSGKAAVAMLTRAVAHELGETGLRVYGFAPGVVDTEMQVQIRASGINPVSQLPRDSLASADDPAQAIVWLCSDAAIDLAGQELNIREPELRQRIGLAV